MEKIDIIDRIFGKYIKKQIETNIKQIKRELINKEKETQYNIMKDKLIPVVGGYYEVLKIDSPCRFSGYLDLWDLKSGETLEVDVKFKSTDGEFKRAFKKEFSGPMQDPLLTFDEKIVDGVSVTLRLSTGITGRTILYNWRWLYL